MTAPAKKSVQLFYDVISPYSWIAFEVLCRYQQKWNIDLKLRPLFLGGIMQGTGNKPPAMVPAKGAYMSKDIQYLSKHYQIPLNFPANPGESVFGPTTSLAAVRFLLLLETAAPASVGPVSRELFRRVWSTDRPIKAAENVAEAAKEAGLSDAVIQDTLSKIKDQSTKDKLKAVVDEALEYGAFGAPTIIATDANNEDHMLFGSDRMHILADILGEKYEGPLVELSAVDMKSKL